MDEEFRRAIESLRLIQDDIESLTAETVRLMKESARLEARLAGAIVALESSFSRKRIVKEVA